VCSLLPTLKPFSRSALGGSANRGTRRVFVRTRWNEERYTTLTRASDTAARYRCGDERSAERENAHSVHSRRGRDRAGRDAVRRRGRGSNMRPDETGVACGVGPANVGAGPRLEGFVSNEEILRLKI